MIDDPRIQKYLKKLVNAYAFGERQRIIKFLDKLEQFIPLPFTMTPFSWMFEKRFSDQHPSFILMKDVVCKDKESADLSMRTVLSWQLQQRLKLAREGLTQLLKSVKDEGEEKLKDELTKTLSQRLIKINTMMMEQAQLKFKQPEATITEEPGPAPAE